MTKIHSQPLQVKYGACPVEEVSIPVTTRPSHG